MSRPMLLVFLLIVLIITSQFEWKQQLVSDVEPSPIISQKQQQISKREEAVKEKVRVSLAAQLALLMMVRLVKVEIILSQEKNIQRLNELVRSLREQLLQCRSSSNESISSSLSSQLADIAEFEKQQILED
ncbi:hypothetical protein RND71_020782 [Anisodus tanguticus]|uniref:Uncharacterized protein n=1 Tax=Anisodus tanguticus TaxID=243964 RepID=A0AAE1V6Q7_9SOLA|nr:hypothetical protein RND71_020782 [Anisodus tanguticus]